MATQQTNRETVAFYRRNELFGVEARTFNDCSRAFRCYATDFEFMTPSSWRGEVWHRRRQHLLEPGTVLCAHPGEVFLSRKVLEGGSLSSLMVDPQVLASYAAEHQLSPNRLQLRALTRVSSQLDASLIRVFETIRPGSSPLELESSFVEFIAAMAGELIDDSVRALAPRADSDLRVAERVRECLHNDASATLDLTSLANQTGMSRFQALRAFKRRYGLPPHTYQLRVRLGLAQKSLREGLQPAHVAAEYGFVDQSHLTRHFKRLVGVTPAQYARIGSAASR
ncbi:MAG: AraC family transcriptional regulator [Myxococcota bacterium]|nr:AraC family transcriptional regulator [Myxococcota bacterium]